MDTFKRWEKDLENTKELNMLEAQELYKEYEKEENPAKKIIIRNKIIEGLLPYTIRIAANRYEKSAVFRLIDKEDLVSLSISHLINCVQSGKLLEKENIGELFQNSYMGYVFNVEYTKLKKTEETSFLSKTNFVNLFEIYINMRNEKEITFDEFKNKVLEDKKYEPTEDYEIIKGVDKADTERLFRDFEKLYKKLENKETYKVDVTKTELNLAGNLLYETMINERVNENSKQIDDMFKDVEIEEIYSRLKGYMDNVLSQRELKVLQLYYGLEGNTPITLTEIAKTFNVSPTMVQIIHQRALKKLRHPNVKMKVI